MYVFCPHDAWQKADVRDSEASDYTIRFAAVKLPSYLDRPHIVTRVADNEIKVEQFHRWGMPLNQTVSELLRGAVAGQLSNAFVDATTATSSHQPGYLVQVDVVRLDGFLGGPVVCIAQWRLTRSGAEPVVLLRRLTRYEQESADRTYEAYIEAIRSLIVEMGEDIAGVIEMEQDTATE